MLALNESIIDIKEYQLKGFEMILKLFGEIATSPKASPDSMSYPTIIAFNMNLQIVVM